MLKIIMIILIVVTVLIILVLLNGKTNVTEKIGKRLKNLVDVRKYKRAKNTAENERDTINREYNEAIKTVLLLTNKNHEMELQIKDLTNEKKELKKELAELTAKKKR